MYYESELYHHGIKGQKWGVQHGPPYPLAEGTKSLANESRNIVNSVSKKSSKKDASSMSDEELKNAVKRMNLENQYNNLSSKEVSRGKQYANAALSGVVSAATIGSSIATIMWAISEIRGRRVPAVWKG